MYRDASRVLGIAFYSTLCAIFYTHVPHTKGFSGSHFEIRKDNHHQPMD